MRQAAKEVPAAGSLPRNQAPRDFAALLRISAIKLNKI